MGDIVRNPNPTATAPFLIVLVLIIAILIGSCSTTAVDDINPALPITRNIP